MSFNWNVSSRRVLIIGALLMLCACAIFVGTPGSASARVVQTQQATTSCYGGAFGFSALNPQAFVLGTTTSRCRDINILLAPPHPLEFVCVIFIWHTTGCNYTTVIGPGDSSWHVIATNVLDGTTFQVSIGSPEGDVSTIIGFIAA